MLRPHPYKKEVVAAKYRKIMNDVVHLRHLNEVSELNSMLDLGFVSPLNTQQFLTTLFESGKWLDKPL
jgi:hypothetical protein